MVIVLRGPIEFEFNKTGHMNFRAAFGVVNALTPVPLALDRTRQDPLEDSCSNCEYDQTAHPENVLTENARSECL